MTELTEFDQGQVLSLAVDRFCAFGYDGTSIFALAETLGIEDNSIYLAFGDKRSLYAAALRMYVNQTLKQTMADLEGEVAPLAAIEAFFQQAIKRMLKGGVAGQCMLLDAMADVVPRHAEIRHLVGETLRDLEAFFHRCIVVGLGDGPTTPETDPAGLARSLLGCFVGMKVLSLARADRSVLEGSLRPVFSHLHAAASRNLPLATDALRNDTNSL